MDPCWSVKVPNWSIKMAWIRREPSVAEPVMLPGDVEEGKPQSAAAFSSKRRRKERGALRELERHQCVHAGGRSPKHEYYQSSSLSSYAAFRVNCTVAEQGQPGFEPRPTAAGRLTVILLADLDPVAPL